MAHGTIEDLGNAKGQPAPFLSPFMNEKGQPSTCLVLAAFTNTIRSFFF